MLSYKNNALGLSRYSRNKYGDLGLQTWTSWDLEGPRTIMETMITARQWGRRESCTRWYDRILTWMKREYKFLTVGSLLREVEAQGRCYKRFFNHRAKIHIPIEYRPGDSGKSGGVENVFRCPTRLWTYRLSRWFRCTGAIRGQDGYPDSWRRWRAGVPRHRGKHRYWECAHKLSRTTTVG